MNITVIFLQAAPNSAIMQLLILGIIGLVIFLAAKFLNRSSASKFNQENDSTIIKSELTNADFRAAGYDLIYSSGRLITALAIQIITILGNVIYWNLYIEDLKSDPFGIKDIKEDIQTVLTIDLILFVISIALMFVGFSSLKDAGKKLYKH
jgi:hypothetical protein